VRTGVGLGFDIDDKFVNPVSYTDQRTALPKAEDSVKFDEPFKSQLLLTKFKHWKYEDEVRMLVPLKQNTAERGIYFFNFSPLLKLREVIIGPLCEIPPTVVCSMVASLYQNVDVIKAELAFKWYEVAKGKTYKIVSPKSTDKNLRTDDTPSS
jgi:competence CoiA-like predicted nuclease